MTLALLFLLPGAACSSRAPQAGKKETRATLESQILKESLAGKLVYVSRDPLPGGKTIPAWRSKIKVPQEFSRAWLYFIDDSPKANWEHPCRYVFVDVKTRKHVIVSASSPPDDMSLLEPLDNEKPKERQ